jgi:hypothetical protein
MMRLFFGQPMARPWLIHLVFWWHASLALAIWLDPAGAVRSTSVRQLIAVTEWIPLVAVEWRIGILVGAVAVTEAAGIMFGRSPAWLFPANAMLGLAAWGALDSTFTGHVAGGDFSRGFIWPALGLYALLFVAHTLYLLEAFGGLPRHVEKVTP